MNTYSFKAECPADVEAFLRKIEGKYEIVEKVVDEEFYDTLIEMKAEASKEKLSSILSTIEDSDVMMETIGEMPIKENELIREHLG